MFKKTETTSPFFSGLTYELEVQRGIDRRSWSFFKKNSRDSESVTKTGHEGSQIENCRPPVGTGGRNETTYGVELLRNYN